MSPVTVHSSTKVALYAELPSQIRGLLRGETNLTVVKGRQLLGARL